MSPLGTLAARLDSAVDRLQPLWAVDPRPGSGRLRGPLGAAIGVAAALLSTAYVLSLRRTFSPWDPNLLQVRPLAYAARRVLRDATAYAPPANYEAFADSPFAAWLGVPLALPTDVLWWWTPVLWMLLHALGLWQLCRIAGLRDWRAGFLAACLPNLQPLRTILPLGGTTALLVLLLTLDLATPRSANPGPARRWLERCRGVPTAVAVAWNPLFLPFVALLWVARGRLPALVAAGGAALATLGAAVLSPRDTLQFFTVVLPARFRAPTAGDVELVNQSALAAWLRVAGPHGELPVRVLLAVVALAAIAAAVVLARRGRLLLAAALAGIGPLIALPVVWPEAYVWVIVATLGLVRGRIPPATRITGLLACGWAVVQPWRPIAIGRVTGDHVATPLDDWVGGIGPALLVVLALAAAYDVVRRPTAPAPGPAARAFVRYGLAWLPWLAALWLAATFLGAESSLWPWHPAMPDFEVYARAGRALVEGRDYYAVEGWPFLYPPFAALFTIPMGLGLRDPAAAVLQLANAAAYSLLFHRAGLRGWQVPMATATAFCLVQVLEADVRMGNVHGLLVAMVFLDLMPGPGGLRRVLPFRWAQRDRLLPAGVLVGVATSIKIVPGLFIVHLLLTRRLRAALTALVTCAATTLLGVLVLPRGAARFAELVVHGGLNSAVQGSLLHYQSLVTALERFWGFSWQAQAAATIVSGGAGFVALLAGARWARAGHVWFGAALCGIATIHLSPVAWNYYYVWLVPAALAVASPRLREAAYAPGETVAQRRAHAVPEWLTLLTLLVAGWGAFQFHLALPAGGGVEDTYSWARRLVAGALPFGTAALGVAALLAHRPRRRRVGAADGETL